MPDLISSTLTSTECSGAGPRKFTPSWSRSRSPYIGSPLNASYDEFFRFMLQFLCLQMCVYGGSAVPQGGLGDRHLVTVPQGVVGDRLPRGGERQGGGGGISVVINTVHSSCCPNQGARHIIFLQYCSGEYLPGTAGSMSGFSLKHPLVLGRAASRVATIVILSGRVY